MKAVVRLMSVPEEKRDMAWVEEALRAAMELELSTIPPYLYAMWSIDPTNDLSNCRKAFRDIVQEEMLHMGIACNLLAAIGAQPRIVERAPVYPARLPTHVHNGLVVNLAPLSRGVLLDTFMVIEEPTTTIVQDDDFQPTGALLIGQFYDGVYDVLEAAAPTFSTAGQLDLSFGGPFTGPFVIANLDQANDAIELIKRQGEGTGSVPFEDRAHPDELAHFYQFGEIYHGRRLTHVPPFEYTGADLTLPGVRAVLPAPADLLEGTAFDQAYSDMLRSLDNAWATAADGGSIGDAVGTMIGLGALAKAVIAKGFGPAFRVLPAEEPHKPGEPAGNRYLQVRQILDTAVGPAAFGAHGPFWRGLSRDQFVAKSLFGEQLVVVGNGADSNLVKALRAQDPFGADVGVAGASFRRMPAGRDPAPGPSIDIIAQWIDDGCPDAAPQVEEPQVSNSTGAFRPDPAVHVAYFRDLDDWSAFHRPPDVDDAIGITFGFFGAWRAYARNAVREQAFVDAVSGAPALQAVTLLATRQQQTVESHYGVPVPLLALLDGYERFGNDGLPSDPLRPDDPRHNMNGAIMWFVLGSFAEACLRLEVARPFWTFMMRPVLCGLLNDGLFRGRFAVDGFAANDVGRQNVFEFVQGVADADLPAELRKRYVQSGL